MKKSVWRHPLAWLAAATMLTGCAGMNRGCTSMGADAFGADWLITQYDMNGSPFMCWKMKGVSVSDEPGGGIQWNGPDGHMMHLNGWYNRAQVANGDFQGAGPGLNVDAAQCDYGSYPANTPTVTPP